MMRARQERFSRKREKRGYSAVEVLVAMTLFAIGAAGVVGMQRTVVQGGNDARHFDQASNIARLWLGRLQRDAMMWTQPNAAFPAANNLANTSWLNVLATGSCTTTWCQPPSVSPGQSGAFDIWGRDLGPTAPAAPHEFCAQYKLNFIAGNSLAPAGTVIRAEVRVVWARIDRALIVDCNAYPAWPSNPDLAPTSYNYHFVYAATTLRPNPGIN
jgi:prepilin-type N-terminal cleavage/methylation domain-containing protein